MDEEIKNAENGNGLTVPIKIENALKQLKTELPGLEIRENEPMSRHGSFHSGGNARAFLAPQSVMSLTKVCSILKDNQLMPFILGNGTNVVFPDEGTPELVVVSMEKLQNLMLLPDGAIYAEAGVSLSRLAAFAQQNGRKGLEFASGIPGTVGGGCFMNAGAYGGELKDAVESVVCYYLPMQQLCELNREQCEFGYRTSSFRKNAGYMILSAVFRLEDGDPEEIAEKMRELSMKRREKQPLEFPSCGSAFKRPEGAYAAALIEECGLKGCRVGGAQVSEKHSGFIINTGNATSTDLYELMKKVRNTVYEMKKIELEPEIILLPPDYRLEDNGPKIHKNLVADGNAFNGGENMQ